MDGCQVPGCQKPIGKKIHRLCHAHYSRWLRTGSVGTKPLQVRKRREAYSFSNDAVAKVG